MQLQSIKNTTKIFETNSMTLQCERIFVFGEDASTMRMVENPEVSAGSRYDLIAYMDFGRSYRSSDGTNARLAKLETIIRSGSLQVLLVDASSLNGSLEYLDTLCRLHCVRLQTFSSPHLSWTPQHKLNSIGGVPLVSPTQTRTRRSMLVKRALDLIGAAMLSVLILPACLMIALAITLESSGPVIFSQRRRMSTNDPPFSMYKFRSMRRGADKEKHLLRNQTDSPLFKVRNDHRVTRVGKIIRRFSIDEIPQLLNVLKGEMSLVGPRPLPVEDLEQIPEQDDLASIHRLRARAKPGMTGLWQIFGRSNLGFRQMLVLDLQYIEHQSLLLDLRILARTVPAVLLGEGAY